MTPENTGLSALRPHALAVLRIVTAYLFFLHGGMKFLGGVDWFSLIGLATALELVGGVLLVLGLFTRPVAFLLSGQMAFAYFMAHAKVENFLLPLKNGGESAVLFCFVFLYLCVAGGGAWALDKLRGSRRATLARA